METELDFLGRALDEPERPFLAILGGAKISGKIDVIEALLPRVDRLLVGGAMANTFFLALGLEVGASLVEADRVDMARTILGRAGDRLLLPVDCVVVDRIEEGATPRIVARDEVGPGDVIGDIGPATREVFAGAIASARTVVWNGPMGVFEVTELRQGTVDLAEAVAVSADRGALTVVGGGDSAAAAEVAGVTRRLSHVSTGGGASLELLSGAELPGVAALSDE
jgi:phosphoglycerate kinase